MDYSIQSEYAAKETDTKINFNYRNIFRDNCRNILAWANGITPRMRVRRHVYHDQDHGMCMPASVRWHNRSMPLLPPMRMLVNRKPPAHASIAKGRQVRVGFGRSAPPTSRSWREGGRRCERPAVTILTSLISPTLSSSPTVIGSHGMEGVSPIILSRSPSCRRKHFWHVASPR